MNNFIDELKLPFQGEMSNKEYVITVHSSDEFSQLFNVIGLNTSLKLVGESVANYEKAWFIYTDGYYEVKLMANWVDDVYSVIISER